MIKSKVISQFEVWSDFRVSQKSEKEIFDFFVQEWFIAPQQVIKGLHLTVYHARRPMPFVQSVIEPCHMSIDTMDLKFMVMMPGGENPRPYFVPSQCKIGVRVHKQSAFRKSIYKYRNRLIEHESKRMLGSRNPSSNSRSAFGARYFQPHITLLKAGTNIDNNLTILGDVFRDAITSITFDKFSIRVKQHY